MRIGLASGSPYYLVPGSKTQTYWIYQGHTAMELLRRGHEVTLMTRPLRDQVGRFDFDVDHPEMYDGFGYWKPSDGVPDVILVDRMIGVSDMRSDRSDSRMNDYVALCSLLESLPDGTPCVYHQHIGVARHSPEFRKLPWLLRLKWTIVNRGRDPQAFWEACIGDDEVVDPSLLTFRRWTSFSHVRALAGGVVPSMVDEPEFFQGLIGRMHENDGRSLRSLRYLDHDEWSRCLIGRSMDWVSRRTGAADLGRVAQVDIIEAIRRFAVTVNVPHTKLVDVDTWPNRVVEHAIAGVVQFFDDAQRLEGLDRWSVSGPDDFIERATPLSDTETRRRELDLQRAVILSEADPDRVIDDIEDILKEAACA